MRTLSPAATRAILAADTDEVFLQCLTINHPDIETIRIVHNTDAVMRAVGQYVPYPFTADLPEDSEEAPSSITISIDNIDREVARLIRNLSGIPTCTLEVVMASSPDVVEIGPFDFSILGSDIDVMTVSLTAGYIENYANQGVPAQTYTPSNSRGLWP
ncbi:DUF1833 family protein [Xanthomonas sp. NCPPB 1068]|uniref:DUF1833 family protein n=1 Tax=Xanthomonas sp. NCPPB 1068 TaxID=487525 RepID=UPI0035560D66